MVREYQSFLLGVLVGSSLCSAYVWFFRKKKNITLNAECLLFSPQSVQFDSHYKENVACGLSYCSICSYNKFSNVLLETKTHLDVCMCLITLEGITDIILKLFNKGVFVRIIIDKQMSEEAYKSKILVFAKNHIPFKLIKSDYIMHNKFFIIDKKTLVTGSFNCTKQAMFQNFENGVIIRNSDLVKEYVGYFQSLWLSAV